MDSSTESSDNSSICKYIFECSLHSAKAFESLNAYRKSGTLCDVTVKVGETTFPAHKVVLSCTSAYFHAMFNSGLREESEDFVELHDLDPQSVEILLDFIYTSKIEIAEENVQRLLPASNLLQLHTVCRACCDFLRRQLDPCNALGILVFADTHSCQDLVETTSLYVLKNFLCISQMEEFLSLSYERVKYFLSSDNLVVGEEENVYAALMKWIKHDLVSRRSHLSQLLACIRLPLLRKDFLMLTVEPEEIIKSDPQCKDLLIEAMKYHLMPEMRRYFQTKRTKFRYLEGTVSYVYVIGGQSLFAIHSDCEVYNPTTEVWHQISAMTIRRSRIGAGVVYEKLYVVGGFDGSQDLPAVEVFNGNTKTWSAGVQMSTCRSCLDIAVLHNLLYAIGGYDGSSCLNSVERFDPLSNQWMTVASMNRKRY